ncbi:MAG: alanine dehydrogenase [Ekhidna sp.]|nr:alanine dehydrogenase [Ekhidna sp.]MBC6410075.1 alanine dehydrogenase [Ekhidna sp.]
MNDISKPGFAQLAGEQNLYPQEVPAKTAKKPNALQIGVPREVAKQEKRVPLKPASVGVLVASGHEIVIQSEAGIPSNFSDQEYSEAGAQVVYSAKEVFECNTILKVEPPSLKEIELMKPGSTLLSAFQVGKQKVKYLEAINKKKLIAIGYEFIQDNEGGLPLVRAMSEIAGSNVMIIAAEYLSSANNGRGIIVGGITGVPPTKVMILGAGTVAEFAARAALGHGAEVRVFDDNIYKMRRLKHTIGHEIHTSTFDASLLGKEAREADVIVGAIRMERGKNKIIISEDMVMEMKPGSVIIDVSIDQGGCIETSEMTSHDNPVFVRHEVIHYCVPNIASRVAQTASLAISNIFMPILQEAGEMGGFDEMIYQKPWLQKGVYSYNGTLTNLNIAKRFNLGYKDLSLFMAARI